MKQLGAVIFMVTAISYQTFAQKNLSEQVNVIRPYKPILAEAVKITSNPEIKFEDQGKNSPEYNFLSYRVDSTLPLKSIASEKMKNESISKLYKSYIRVAGGNYRTSYAEAWLNNLRSKDWSLGAHVYHRAQVGQVDNMDYSANRMDVFGKKMMGNQDLSLSAHFDRDVRHYYGYDQDLFNFSERDVRQRYQFFGFKSSLQSKDINESKGLKYLANFDFYGAANENDARENRFNISSDLRYDQFGLGVGLDLARFTDSLSAENNLFYFEPSYKFEQYGIRFDVGFNIYQEFGAISATHLYPSIEARYHLTDIDAEAFVGLDGKVRKNSFRDFYKANPFLSEQQIIENTNEKLHVYIGIKGRIDVKNAYLFSFDHYNLANEAYFVSDTTVERSFKIIYDGNNASQSNFNIDFSHQSNNKLRLLAGFTYSLFNTDTVREAYHRPNSTLRLGADYNIANKFLLEAQLYSYSGMKAPDSKGNLVDLEGGVDLNLGIDYRYSKIISVYLNLNNVLNYKREQYLNYSGYGFQAMLGASFRF
jgi:hypothetical protein